MAESVTTEKAGSSIVEKWGKEVAERGFAQIPNHLLLLNQFLERDSRLSAAELQVLYQLAGSWWRKGEMPFPSMRTLAIRSGISERQVQRAITRLEGLGLLKRMKRRAKGIVASNAYDLSPLVEVLKQVAVAFPNAFPRNVRQRGMAIPNSIIREVALDSELSPTEHEGKIVL